MKPIQAACFSLLASAFVLAAILVVGLGQNSQDNAAMADGQNVAGQNFQLMTARTRGEGDNSEESLFILVGDKIIVYTPNVGQQELEPKTVVTMQQLF